MTSLDTAQDKQLYTSADITEAKEKFNKHIIDENAIATNDITAEKFDMDKAKQKCSNALVALDVDGGLQSMLAAQMLSIHKLQQRTVTYAHAVDSMEQKKYYISTAIKLANCFAQQANVLAKLQGVGGQKIIVERVDVHQGGQAIVGSIQGGYKEK